MSDRILITGGGGFIGRYLCRECDRQGIDYCVLKTPEEEYSGKAVYTADIRDRDALRAAIRDLRPDAVIHLAAIASAVHSDVTEIYDVNVRGTENLLEAARDGMAQGARLVLVSTAGVYGNQQAPLLTEDLPFNPANHYSFSKMVTEILSRQYTDELDIHIVRPFNIVGSGQNKQFLIPKLVEHYARRSPQIKLGNLDPKRDYVSVEFCAQVMLELALSKTSQPDVVNVCSGTGHSCRQVLELLTELTGHEPEVLSTAEFSRKNEVWSLVGSTERLRQVMGARETGPLRLVLEEMLSAAKAGG